MKGYNLAFARTCLKLGQLAGSIGATIAYQGQRGSAKHWCWQAHMAGVHGFNQSYKTAEEMQAYLEGRRDRMKAEA